MTQVESNVIYGMYSGLALLMDVYRPAAPNGYGVLYVNGSGWHAALAQDATPLKSLPATAQYATPLVEAGYTLFAVNHRAAPRFRYPAAVEDVQRAVRFIRYHATEYAIRSDRMGAYGGSSGGHLVSLLGVLHGAGDEDDPDLVNRESARVQCVVARAAPVDMTGMVHEARATGFMGMPLLNEQTSREYETYRQASPVSFVTGESPPFLLIHGDADMTVPFAQSELMQKTLQDAGVKVRLLRIPGGGHGPTFPGAANPPDYLGEMVSWFDEHLKAG